MVAYMDAAAEAATRDSGHATYFSRSRGRQWRKGETSGNVQRVCRIDRDCDRDAILLSVRQSGSGACHTGATSCFAAGVPAPGPVLLRLERTIRDRLARAPQGSYTAALAAQGVPRVAQKVVEEAGEVAIAAVTAGRAAVVREAADLVYHLWLLLAVTGVSYAEVAEELAGRETGVARAEGAAPAAAERPGERGTA
jgi:phosphoribosyl-ATP pyrophosphohydrolase/phosphoribosyl-AMP cyclohydrolase